MVGKNQEVDNAERMEAKLKEYRAIRRRKWLKDNVTEKYEKSKATLVNLFVPKIIQDMARVHDDEAPLLENEEQKSKQPMKHPIQPIEEFDLDGIDVVSETSETEVESFDENEIPCRFCIFRWVLRIAVWLVFWGVFLYLQFGAVYFVISILIAIYRNTRTGPRKPGEVSAYSVFNRNCVSIEGSLKPEQFEREIRYGVGTIRNF